MKTLPLKLFLLLLFCASGTLTRAQNFNPLLATMLQDTLHTYASQIANIKGISASVYIPGQGIWRGTYGNSYTDHPITSDMAFGIASNTKLFASTMLLKLAQTEVLSLDDSLHQWLPPYPNVNPDITVRQLLNHTSGISDPIFVAPLYDSIMANPGRVFSPDEVLSYLGPPLFEPGTSWSYSNVNYILAGMIAQEASGTSFSQLIRSNILDPLNMDSSFYDVEEPEIGELAHRWWNGTDYHDTSRVALNTAAGFAGALFSTSSEMAQWYAALFSGQIISAASLNQLRSFVPTSNPNYQYGLGLARETTQAFTYYTHGGDTWGYKSKMIQDTCMGTNVCVLSNSFPSGIPAISFLLYRVIKNHIPGCAGAITGADTLCAGSQNISYTLPSITHADSYTWTLPPGATALQNGNTITVNFDNDALSGTITATGINAYGPGGSAGMPVQVIALPPAPQIVQNGNTLSSSANSGNQWYNSYGPIAGATEPEYTVTESDTYYCVVSQNGCSSALSNQVQVELLNQPPACVMDANADGVIGVQDLNAFLSYFGQSGNYGADFNGDGNVNVSDLVLFLSYYGENIALECEPCTALSLITDPRDGELYEVISIGEQCWFAENLRYSGAILEVQDDADWNAIWLNNTQQPAWCYYGNNPDNNELYGKLYNGYALISGNVCPAGWHVPNNEEWAQLTDFLGGLNVAGGKMKALIGWNAPNTGATNSSGFTGPGGGYRHVTFGNALGMGTYGYWWSSTPFDATGNWATGLRNSAASVDLNPYQNENGFSVRCLRD